METFFGVRFLASEYATGKVHGGRIDSLGLDENGCPVIFEYKRSSIKLERGFTSDVSKTGHFGTGDLKVTLKSFDDFEKAKDLILQSYEGS